MRKVRADLHLHTCLSPCADEQMQAKAIVKQARRKGLDMIGVCDHNSAENVVAVIKAGLREGLSVVAGMEITSRQQVHILGLFENESDVMQMQELVYENLSKQRDEGSYGPQTLVDEWDHVVGTSHRLLVGATSLGTEQIIDAIHERRGLAIASHMDREQFRLIGQLGFIPKGLHLDAVEVGQPSSAGRNYGYPVVTSSDAHFLEDVGKSFTDFLVEDLSLDEIRMALRGNDGRRVLPA